MLKTTTVSPEDVIGVYSCELCEKEEKESISNIAQYGSPMCIDCDIEMGIDHVIVNF